MNSTEIVRYHMNISGSVQGVGFRYRARYAAQGLYITGWVKNEWDGTVTMEVQGTLDQIDRMLTMINSGSYISIDGIKKQQLPVDPEERGFHVR